jgi:outer membrane protein assembly factor BamB
VGWHGPIINPRRRWIVAPAVSGQRHPDGYDQGNVTRRSVNARGKFARYGKPAWLDRGWRARQLGRRPASSPIIHQGRVYVVNDNETGSFLLALDKLTGKELWKVARDEKSNWSTPVIWKNGLRTEIVTTGSSKVRS